jgi:hypothetical protein
MNRDVLLQVADRIEQDPDSYNQNTWGRRTACGTAFCIAGHVAAATLPPENLVWQRDPWQANSWFLDEVRDLQGRKRMVKYYARDVLDMDTEIIDVDGDIEVYVGDLFDGDWEPVDGMTAPEALRAVADGASLASVTNANLGY